MRFRSPYTTKQTRTNSHHHATAVRLQGRSHATRVGHCLSSILDLSSGTIQGSGIGPCGGDEGAPPGFCVWGIRGSLDDGQRADCPGGVELMGR